MTGVLQNGSWDIGDHPSPALRRRLRKVGLRAWSVASASSFLRNSASRPSRWARSRRSSSRRTASSYCLGGRRQQVVIDPQEVGESVQRGTELAQPRRHGRLGVFVGHLIVLHAQQPAEVQDAKVAGSVRACVSEPKNAVRQHEKTLKEVPFGSVLGFRMAEDHSSGRTSAIRNPLVSYCN